MKTKMFKSTLVAFYEINKFMTYDKLPKILKLKERTLTSTFLLTYFYLA